MDIPEDLILALLQYLEQRPIGEALPLYAPLDELYKQAQEKKS